jgi:octopamine receptor beta
MEINETLAANLLSNESFHYAIEIKILLIVLYIPILILSILGNILVLIAIKTTELKEIPGNLFLGSLAITDFGVALTAMPLYGIQMISEKWYFTALGCRLWFCFDVMFSTASILHLFCLSMDRYLSISNFYAYIYINEGSKRVYAMITTVWLLSASIAFIPILTDTFTTTQNAAAIDRLDYDQGKCIFEVNLIYRIISSSISFWIPSIGMITFYSLVIIKASKIAKCLKSNQIKYLEKPPSTSRELSMCSKQSSSCVSVKTSQKHKSKFELRDYKALKTLGTVIAVFLICWFPFFLNYTICSIDIYDCEKNLFGHKGTQIKEDILFTIGYLNSMINPFLYNFTNKEFRKAFVLVLKNLRYFK